jgi:adenylate kinase
MQSSPNASSSRTAPAASSSTANLADRGIDLDVVIEFVVDDRVLVDRIVKRAEQAKAAGQPVRKDDNPEVFDERLREYYKKTSPLIGYYYAKGKLKGVDGMADIDSVTAEIEALLRKTVRKKVPAGD